MLLLPGEIQMDLSRHVVEGARLDSMQELHRYALCGDQIVPAPGHVPVRIELQNSGGEGVAAAKVIEQPPIEAGRSESSLNSWNISGAAGHGAEYTVGEPRLLQRGPIRKS